jgi:hypothetical protein
MGAIGSGGIKQVEVAGTEVLWTETRADDGRRTTLICRAADGAIADLPPARFDVRDSGRNRLGFSSPRRPDLRARGGRPHRAVRHHGGGRLRFAGSRL